MEYFWVSVIPNHNKEMGIQLIDGSGLNSDIIGSNTALEKRDDPRKMPNGMATRLEIKKPTITRLVEASTCKNRVPWVYILTAREKICDGAGKKMGSINPSRQTISHRTIITMKDARLT